MIGSEWQEYFGVIAGALVPFATLAYAVGVVRGNIIPALTTWIVWATLATIMVASMYAQNALNYQVIGGLCADIVIVLLALRFGVLAGQWIDAVCLNIAAVAIALWYFTADANLALALAIFATVVGFAPLAIALWRSPTNERVLPWAIMVVSTLFQFAALKEWTFATAAQPVLYMIMPFVVLALIARGKFAK